MKLHHKIVTGVVSLIIGSMAITACTDDVKFGDSFIEKAPGLSWFLTRVDSLSLLNGWLKDE